MIEGFPIVKRSQTIHNKIIVRKDQVYKNEIFWIIFYQTKSKKELIYMAKMLKTQLYNAQDKEFYTFQKM